jgi:hypothetical protein
MAFLTIAVIREHVCPANPPLRTCRQCPRVTACGQSDVPVSYPRLVVCSQNEQRRLGVVALAERRGPQSNLDRRAVVVVAVEVWQTLPAGAMIEAPAISTKR